MYDCSFVRSPSIPIQLEPTLKRSLSVFLQRGRHAPVPGAMLSVNAVSCRAQMCSALVQPCLGSSSRRCYVQLPAITTQPQTSTCCRLRAAAYRTSSHSSDVSHGGCSRSRKQASTRLGRMSSFCSSRCSMNSFNAQPCQLQGARAHKALTRHVMHTSHAPWNGILDRLVSEHTHTHRFYWHALQCRDG